MAVTFDTPGAFSVREINTHSPAFNLIMRMGKLRWNNATSELTQCDNVPSVYSAPLVFGRCTAPASLVGVGATGGDTVGRMVVVKPSFEFAMRYLPPADYDLLFPTLRFIYDDASRLIVDDDRLSVCTVVLSRGRGVPEHLHDPQAGHNILTYSTKLDHHQLPSHNRFTTFCDLAQQLDVDLNEPGNNLTRFCFRADVRHEQTLIADEATYLFVIFDGVSLRSGDMRPTDINVVRFYE